jgi:zinc and cadmium transporter
MTFFAILLGTFAAGIGSVLIAALLTYGVLARFTQHLLSLAAGALLATAFMHLLPEAIESAAGAKDLFATLLACLIFFFLLDKAQLYHHGHEHGHGRDHSDAHANSHAHTHTHAHGSSHTHSDGHAHESYGPRSGGWAVLVGDSVHCFGDGILIASAFLADWKLGTVAALAVLAHEIPHHMGDLVVLRQSETSSNPALLKLCLAGGVTVLGGVVGYFLVAQLENLLPFMLVIASGSFIYVALADLIPQLQKRLSLRETVAQIAWLAVGVGLVTLTGLWTHSH